MNNYFTRYIRITPKITPPENSALTSHRAQSPFPSYLFFYQSLCITKPEKVKKKAQPTSIFFVLFTLLLSSSILQFTVNYLRSSSSPSSSSSSSYHIASSKHSDNLEIISATEITESCILTLRALYAMHMEKENRASNNKQRIPNFNFFIGIRCDVDWQVHIRVSTLVYVYCVCICSCRCTTNYVAYTEGHYLLSARVNNGN